MAKAQSVISSSDESEGECLKRKHQRHDRFKIERNLSIDEKVKDKIEENELKVKTHKHKRHKTHKHRNIYLNTSDKNAIPLKKITEHSLLIGSKHILSEETVTTPASGCGIISSVPTNTIKIVTELSDHVIVEKKQSLCGPSLPPGFKTTTDNTYGPVLPPKFAPQIEENQSSEFGPALPPMFLPSVDEIQLSNKDNIFGPALPPKFVPSFVETELLESEDLVGPVLEGFIDSSESVNYIQHQLTSRANYLRTQLAKEGEKSKDDTTRRESWMLELPPEKSAIIGLGPRSFRRREGPDMSDRSSWTDTPETKLKKEMEGKTGEGKEDNKLISEVIQARDVAMEQHLAASSSKHRVKSLLEIHQKKRKKKLKKERKEKNAVKPERRPFDRNVDLEVNRFDKAQRKAIYKKAQLLDTRFSSGESKFL